MNQPKQNYFIRLDGAIYDEKDLEEFLDIIRSGLPENFVIKTFSVLNYQQKSKLKSISLDKFFMGDYSLNVSRVFKYQDTVRPIRMTNSPESISLKDQIALIPKGDYVLIDDDTVSGYTIGEMVKTLKSIGVNIKAVELIMASFGKYIDVIDLKDFIVGMPYGGLVSLLQDDSLIRVPYLHPFINLTQRASILPEHVERVSSKLWRFNQRYHAKHKDKFVTRTSMQSKIINCLLPEKNTESLNFSQIVDLLAEKYLK